MSKKAELAKNTAIIFLGKISTQFITFFLLPLYTAYLATDDYGLIDLIITYISLIIPVFTLQQEMATFRFLIDARSDEEKKAKVIYNSFKSIFACTIVFVLIYFIICLFINIPFKYYILSNVIVTIFSSLLLQISRGLGKNIIYSVSCFIAGFLTFAFNVLFIIVFKFGAEGILLSTIISNLICVIFLSLKLNIFHYLKKKYEDKHLIREMLKYSFPLVPNGISWWIINVSDRTIITIVLNSAKNGIYAVSNKFSSIITALFSIFGLSWTESASVHINDSDRDYFFSEISDVVIKFFSCICLGIVAFMPFVFSIFIKSNYNEAYNYIPINLLAAFFNCIVGVYSSIYIAKKLTKKVAMTSILSAVINISFNVLFIKFIGLYAACISTVLAYFIMAIYRHFDLKKYVNLKYKITTLTYTLLSFLLVYICYYINNFYLNIICLVFTVIYSIIINKKMIKKIFNKIMMGKKLKKMKDKIYKIIKILFMILPIFISGYFIKVIKDLNMVPNKYLIPLIIILIIINVLIVLGLICKKIVFNIIGFILSIIIIIGSLYGIKHGNKISNFINKSFNNNNLEVTVASVVVLKNSNYEKLEDLNDKVMGYVTIDDNKDEYSSIIKSKITVELKSYDNVYKLYESLLNKESDSIIINEAYLDLLQDEYEDINDKIKVIYNLEIENKINNSNNKVSELKPVNILISGSDSRSGQIVSKTRSDVNMIMTIDPKNHKILLTSIPRDYYVKLHGTSGNKDKLTHAGIYGINMTKETLEDLFDIKIDYTIKVGFRTVEEIVDYIGGIEIDSDRSFVAWGNGAKIEQGKHILNGKQALGYARERHAYKEGDNRRIQNQQQVLEAIISKVVSQKSLLKKYDELLDLFSELYRTDIPSDFIKLIVKDQLNSMKSWKVEKQQVSGSGARRETYSMPGRDLYVAIPDMDSVKEAREKILSIIDGE